MAKRSPRKKGRSVGRPTKGRGNDTEAQILDAAERVFARVGFPGARTLEIAEAANVTKAMIHYYFDSKERLYHAVLDRILFELIRLVQDVSTQEMGRLSTLDAFLSGFFDYVARHPHFGRLTFMGGGSQSRYFENLVSNFLRPLFDRGVRFIEEGIEEGRFRKVDATQLMLHCYAIISSYFADAHFISLVLGDDAMKPEYLESHLSMLRDIVFTTLGVEAPTVSPEGLCGEAAGQGEEQQEASRERS